MPDNIFDYVFHIEGLVMKIIVNLPNGISLCRLMLVPVMLWCCITGNRWLFTWLLFIALISDIADGMIARIFHLETDFGSVLDACADMGMYISAVTAIFVFQRAFIQEYWIAICIILAFYIVEKVKTYMKYGKIFNAFHTWLSKATAYLQGAFIMSLFFWGIKPYFFYPAMVLSIAANIEEMILTSILPTYEHDVRGLYWILKRRKQQVAKVGDS